MTKTKPNAPCVCGSGKKYKKCCKTKIQTQQLKPAASAPLSDTEAAVAAVAAGSTGQPQQRGSKNTTSAKTVRSGGGGMGARVRSHTSGGNSCR
jgi:uncharacterized protein YchJ